jgi:hypothetical protein
MSRRTLSKLALCLVAVLSPAAAGAQAWLPDKGAFNTSLIYNNVLNKVHWTATGDQVDAGHTRSETIAFLANYAITDRVMVSGSLPYVNTKFWGPPSHGGAPGFDVDNGEEHGSFTDLRVGVHFQALEQPFALAPFVAYVTPISDYYYRGHAAQGRNVEELLIGFGAGKSLDRWLRRTFVQMRYSYSFVEKVLDRVHDRENLNLEIGTFINSRWNVSAYGAFQWTHGGLDAPIPASSPYFYNHDSLLEEEYINAGVGTGYALTSDLTAFAIYMHGFEGRNGHKMNQGLTLGFSYGFRPRAEAVGVAEASE